MNTTIAKRQVRGLNSTFFFFCMYVRYACMCVHVCLRAYWDPNLTGDVFLACSLSYILR